MIKPILIWTFEDAPKTYQDMSKNGGDEDYIALIPPNYKHEYLGFLESGTAFGCSGVEELKLENGYTLLIGSHA